MKENRSPAVYTAAERFREAALRSESSLFTPNESIWTLDTVENLHLRFNQRPDTSSDSFEIKLRRQLEGAPDATLQLMAEAIFVHFLVVDDISGKAKRAPVHQVLSWMTNPVEIPEGLDRALDQGLAAGGLSFKTWRPFQLRLLIEFFLRWRSAGDDERRSALADPWRFKEFLWQVPVDSGYAMREALLHLIFPDAFEDIVSREHKALIAKAFAEYVAEPAEDVDRRLQQIRERLQEEHGAQVGFYDPEVRPRWYAVATDPKPWDEFVEWGKKVHEWPGFDESEYDYKLRVAEPVQAARDAVLNESDDWLASLRDAFSFKENNLTRWQAHDQFLTWCDGEPAAAEAALCTLWSGSETLLARLQGFFDALPRDLLAGADRLRIVSFLLMAVDPHQHPPMMASALKNACKLTGYPPPAPAADESRRYRHGLMFFDRAADEAANRGLELRDRLDAQSVAWALAENNPPDDFPDEDRKAFLAWRSGGASQPPAARDAEPAKVTVPSGPSLGQLADELFLPEEFLADVLTMLRERKQIVLYGPPGTGKTYVARRLARYLAPDEADRQIVQFHPSYSYEDFVAGYRPVSRNGALSYELTDGPLRELADRARANVGREHVLLIDEINRGNLPRILGELLYVLEYRGEPVRAMYGGEPLVLPANLLIISTMNTADRSIGLIDAALRRRFHFVPMFPGEGPLANLLGQWLDEYRPEMREVADIVNLLNRRLRERVGRHLQVGHSYFLREDLSQEVLTRIWNNDVMPFLEEQFFGDEGELAQFTLDRLRTTGDRDADDSAAGAAGDTLRLDEG